MSCDTPPPTAAPPVGIGLKAVHLPDLLADPSDLDFVEVHAENYMVDGGPRLRQLEQVRERLALSVHGVGLGLGGAGPLSATHLARLEALLHRFEPRWFSEHLAWSSHAGVFYNDLLPLPYNTATCRRVGARIDAVQTRLRRPLLLENPSTYVEFAASTMDEGAFLSELVRRTGCGLLLDVNNAYVSAVNHGRDPWALIAALPPAAVGEVHLAGYGEDRDGAGDRLLIDTHGTPVSQPVWDLYRRTVQHLGPRPTLIERDQALPAFPELLAEARVARDLAVAAASTPTAGRPVPRPSVREPAAAWRAAA